MPIHIFSKVGLQFQLNSISYCPGISKFQEEAKNQEEVIKIVNEFIQFTNETYGQEIFTFMNVSGKEAPNYLYINNNLNYICDTYIADYIAGRDMPHIYNTGIDMDHFYHHCLNYSIIDAYYITYGLPPTKLSYLTVSPVFRTIINYMDRRIKYFKENHMEKIDPSSPKFVIYSGHDSNIAAMDVFLKDVFKIQYDKPEYTTSQLFELWHNSSGYFVKYLYNQREKAVYELENFKKIIDKNILPQKEINEICQVNDKNKKFRNDIEGENIYKKIFIIIVGLIIISSGFLISITILKRRNE